jgi:hypothetical protein
VREWSERSSRPHSRGSYPLRRIPWSPAHPTKQDGRRRYSDTEFPSSLKRRLHKAKDAAACNFLTNTPARAHAHRKRCTTTFREVRRGRRNSQNRATLFGAVGTQLIDFYISHSFVCLENFSCRIKAAPRFRAKVPERGRVRCSLEPRTSPSGGRIVVLIIDIYQWHPWTSSQTGSTGLETGQLSSDGSSLKGVTLLDPYEYSAIAPVFMRMLISAWIAGEPTSWYAPRCGLLETESG